MTLPFTLPDWLPPWVFLLIALPFLLYALVFLIMPFSVFGVKARLETLESQLDAIHEELRYISNRPLSPGGRFSGDEQDFDTLPHFGRLKTSQAEALKTPVAAAPPVPPPPFIPSVEPRTPRLPQRAIKRTEPRLD